MKTETESLIVTTDDCVCQTVHIASAHHPHYPELRGEGASPVEAAAHLARQLASLLESGPSDWRRQGIEKALEDVRAFLAHGV